MLVAINRKQPLFSRAQPGVSRPVQMLQFSGGGFAPDLFSEDSLHTLPEASKTTLEEGVYGVDGMMPAPGHVGRPLIPGYPEGGTGGAGSFATRVAAPKSLR